MWRNSLAGDPHTLKEGLAAKHSLGHHSVIVLPPSLCLPHPESSFPHPHLKLTSLAFLAHNLSRLSFY